MLSQGKDNKPKRTEKSRAETASVRLASAYTGMTDDFPRRLAQHRAGKGAKYTRGRAPLEPVYREDCESRQDALKREYAIKRLSRAQKLALITKQQYTTDDLA